MRIWNFLIICLVLGLMSCGKNPEAKLCHGNWLCTEAGKIISWKNQSKVIFHFSENFPEDRKDHFSDAFEQYNDVLAKVQISFNDHEPAPNMVNNNPSSVVGDRYNGLYFVEGDWPWEKSHPGSQAITVTKHTGSNIVEADVFIKKTISFYGDLRTVDFLLGAHEFGHVLGLQHTKNQSIMQATVQLSLASAPLTCYDITALRKAYTVNIQSAEENPCTVPEVDNGSEDEESSVNNLLNLAFK